MCQSVPSHDTLVRFNKERRTWENLGDAAEASARRLRAEYEASPIVKTVRKLLEQSPGKEWTGTATQLMEAGKYITRQYLASSARALVNALNDLDASLLDMDGILHTTASNGTAGRRHTFRYADAPRFREVFDQQEIPF